MAAHDTSLKALAKSNTRIDEWRSERKESMGWISLSGGRRYNRLEFPKCSRRLSNVHKLGQLHISDEKSKRLSDLYGAVPS